MKSAIYGMAAFLGLMAFDNPAKAQGFSFGYSNYKPGSSFSIGIGSGGYQGGYYGGYTGYRPVYLAPAPVYGPPLVVAPAPVVVQPVYRPVPYYGGYGHYNPYRPYYGPRW